MAFTTSHIIVATTAPIASQAFPAAALLNVCCARPAAVKLNIAIWMPFLTLPHNLGKVPTNTDHPFVVVRYKTRTEAIGSITCAMLFQFSITDFTRLIIADIVV